MNGKDMAAALGISEAMVSRLRKRGMPMDELERAERWRRRNMAPARMKGARMDIQQAPTAQPVHPRRTSLVVEFERVARSKSIDQEPRELPAPVADYLRALLQQMPFVVFRHLWTGESVPPVIADTIDRLLPRAFLEWGYASPSDDDDVTEAELPMLHQLAAGSCGFEWDADGPWPAFIDCIRARPAVLHVSIARQSFETFAAAR